MYARKNSFASSCADTAEEGGDSCDDLAEYSGDVDSFGDFSGGVFVG